MPILIGMTRTEYSAIMMMKTSQAYLRFLCLTTLIFQLYFLVSFNFCTATAFFFRASLSLEVRVSVLRYSDCCDSRRYSSSSSVNKMST